MARSWTRTWAQNRSTSPRTRGRSGVVSMITTFSGAAVRSEISDAGKFSRLQYQRPSSAWRTWPSSARNASRSSAGAGPEHLARLERQLERRAREVGRAGRGGCPGRAGPPRACRSRRNSGMVDDVLVDRRGRGDEDGDARAPPPAGPARSAARWPRSSPGSRPGSRRRGDRCRRRARGHSSRRRRGSRRRAARARSSGARSAGSRRGSRGSAMRGPRSSRSASRRPVSTISTATRDRPKTIVWRPARRNGSAQRWASVRAEPRAPVAASMHRRVDEQDVALAGRRAIAIDESSRPAGEHPRRARPGSRSSPSSRR